jgi:hypothetical protein
MVANRTREMRPSGMTRGAYGNGTMEKAKPARKAETPKQPSLRPRSLAPCLYPDPGDSPVFHKIARPV